MDSVAALPEPDPAPSPDSVVGPEGTDAVVPIPDADDRNLIVNHRHAEAARITVSRIEKFDYDPRLFAFA